MKKFFSFVSHEADDFKILLRNIPSLTVSIFILSVVCANLMANKELVNFKFVALDCGFAFSWIMFLCMDVICKRWGAKAAIKISLVALAANLFICVSFALLAKTPGMWGEYYTSENSLVNDALNATFAGSWYVVLGSSVAFVSSSVVNALLNCAIGSLFKSDGFFSFASRSYISTAIAQLVDNFIFATIVSKIFFGWTWIQVFVCSAIGAGFELLGEIFFSGLGYKVVRQWEKEKVGQEYIEYKKARAK
ncbi:VUT family protein [uncultured Treponema sp.]|uniref:VUT family protein n=1 Tax=uncultured Treponema sp. TaxID=162155 RepID=UPI00280AA1A1|nr:VUT family protein [uncultured Treponema sp.]